MTVRIANAPPITAVGVIFILLPLQD
jgi:hypothetical protein